jgi:hypothetical protein
MHRTILLSAAFSCNVIDLLFIDTSDFKSLFKINQEQVSLKGSNWSVLFVSYFSLNRFVFNIPLVISLSKLET